MSSSKKNAIACKPSGNALSPLGRRAVKSSVAIGGICSTGFMGNSNPVLNLKRSMNFSRLETDRPKSANIEPDLTDAPFAHGLFALPDDTAILPHRGLCRQK